jgi:hypothetical protein
MAEQPTFVYLLMSTLWLAVLFGGIALIIKLWLPGRREHKERMKAMELEAKRLAEAEHAKKIGLKAKLPAHTDPFARMDETFARMDNLFKTAPWPMWTSVTTTEVTPPENVTEPDDPEAVAAAAKVTEAMTQLNDAVAQVREAMKAHMPQDAAKAEAQASTEPPK